MKDLSSPKKRECGSFNAFTALRGLNIERLVLASGSL
jgi:hypothetical protein